MTKTRTARCLCGDLTVTVTGEAARVMICSCADCRRKSGSAYSVSTYWPREAATIEGPINSYTRPAPEGRSLTYHFCPTCGVAPFWEADFRPEWYGVAGGCFDDNDYGTPVRSYWTCGRPDWAGDLADIEALDRQ